MSDHGATPRASLAWAIGLTQVVLVASMASFSPAALAGSPGGAPGAVAPAAEVPANRFDEAKVHFEQGIALFRERNYDAALIEFQASYRLFKQPVALYNIGLTNKEVFRYADAIDALKEYLRASDEQGVRIDERRRAEVEATIAGMESLLADVAIDISPPGATVRIDGRPTSLNERRALRLPAGTHRMEITAEGFTTESREIAVVAGVAQTLEISLRQIPRTGKVRISATEIGAEVYLDGQARGRVPIELDLPPGGHQIEVSAPEFMPARTELVVAAGQSRMITMRLERMPPPVPEASGLALQRRWWFWAGLAAVAAGTSVGIFLAAQPSPQPPLPGSLGAAKADP